VRSRLVRGGLVAAACAASLLVGSNGRPSLAQGAPPAEAAARQQTVLGPGLYIFQTRTRDASCGDSEADGYVISYFAAIHGIPHSLEMKMELVNTPHFKDWVLKVAANTTIRGDARIGTAADSPETHFEVKLEGDRFKGTGARTYNGSKDGKKVRCQVNYDTLLRRLD